MRILCFLICILAIGCRCPQLAIQSSKDSSYVEHKVDTVWMPGKIIKANFDLAYLCDSIYALKKDEINLDQLITDGVVRASIKKNMLHVSSPCPPNIIVHDTTMVNQVKTETLTIVKEAEETWWQRLYKWGFWILLVAVGAGVYFKIQKL